MESLTMLASFLALVLAAINAATAPVALCLFFLDRSTTSVVSAESGTDGKHVTLDEDLFNRALAHAAAHKYEAVDRLRNGEVEALYDVAESMNQSGDKISSVLIWHALADDGSQGDDYEAYDSEEGYDYVGHVPSALALGFSYYDVDKPRSLHYFLMATSKNGAPHQAAMYNAGRLYIELDDPSAALAYIRACATLDTTHPAYARPQLSMTCHKAYDILSDELIQHHLAGESDMGLEEAVECFVYANMEDFPVPNTREFQAFDGAMDHLQKYAEIARGKGDISKKATRTKALKHLNSANESLLNFQSKYRDSMSKLQLFLVGYIVERVRALANQLESESDEL